MRKIHWLERFECSQPPIGQSFVRPQSGDQDLPAPNPLVFGKDSETEAEEISADGSVWKLRDNSTGRDFEIRKDEEGKTFRFVG